HATGDANACLIASLMQHAIGSEPSGAEVQKLRKELVKAGIIADQEAVDVFADNGRAVVKHINEKYGTSLRVRGVYNGQMEPADIENDPDGDEEVLLYLAPGHYVPIWSKGGSGGGGGAGGETKTKMKAKKKKKPNPPSPSGTGDE